MCGCIVGLKAERLLQALVSFAEVAEVVVEGREIIPSSGIPRLDLQGLANEGDSICGVPSLVSQHAE
jgi:hypothetical protein